MLIIIISAIFLSINLAILGVISLWKRYVYFADGVAHSGLLTIAIATTLNLPLIYSGLFVTLIFAWLIFKFQKYSGRNEAIIMIANIMLAIALIITNLSPVRIEITSLLFGDLIATNFEDLFIISTLLLVTIIFICLYYRQIILIVLNEDLAFISGIKVKKIELIFLTVLALSVFIAIKIVGVLLVTTILLLPAMTARLIAKTPYQMLSFALIIALLSTVSGLTGAFYLNMPIAPIIILVGASLYIIFYNFNSF